MDKIILIKSPFLLVILFTFLGITALGNNLVLNAKVKGAKGDGSSDDRIVIQKAIDELVLKGGGTLYFPKGTYAIYNQSLVVWGANISLIGEDKNLVSIIKRGKAGQYGDCIDIMGKINDFYYFGDFGKGDYNFRKKYFGSTQKAKNIVLKNITIKSNLSTYNKLANNLGIVNSENVKIENCILSGAPQSNVAVVNDKRFHSNGEINFLNCTFENSGAHNVRVISYNTGSYDGNFVKFQNCNFLSVKSNDPQVRDLANIGNKVHLWYRGSSKSGRTSLVIENCNFDSSGIVYNNVNPNNLIISNSRLNGGLIIKGEERFNANPNITISNNTIKESPGKVINNIQKRSSTNDALKVGVFGNSKISNSKNIKILNNVYN